MDSFFLKLVKFVYHPPEVQFSALKNIWCLEKLYMCESIKSHKPYFQLFSEDSMYQLNKASVLIYR